MRAVIATRPNAAEVILIVVSRNHSTALVFAGWFSSSACTTQISIAAVLQAE